MANRDRGYRGRMNHDPLWLYLIADVLLTALSFATELGQLL